MVNIYGFCRESEKFYNRPVKDIWRSKKERALKESELGEALKYYTILAVIYSAMSALLFILWEIIRYGNLDGRETGATAIGFFVQLFVFAVIGALVVGVVLHIGVYIIFIVSLILHIFCMYVIGGRRGIAKTIKAVMYGLTPFMLLGWIPVVNLIAGIWSGIILFIGIRELHDIKNK